MSGGAAVADDREDLCKNIFIDLFPRYYCSVLDSVAVGRAADGEGVGRAGERSLCAPSSPAEERRQFYVGENSLLRIALHLLTPPFVHQRSESARAHGGAPRDLDKFAESE